MKKTILICIALFMAVGLAAAKKKEAPEGTPSIKFTETVWDFGVIKKDRPATHEFEFVNEGPGNLIIKEATAECGCTRPEWPDKPIAPGKKGKIKVNYLPMGRPESFEKTVTVRTNGSPRKVHLKIRGVVGAN